MDKFYVVGFYKPGYGDALVRADSNTEALTKVRRAGYTPNSGDRYLVPASGRFSDGSSKGYLNDDLGELLPFAETSPNDVFIIWIQEREGV